MSRGVGAFADRLACRADEHAGALQRNADRVMASVLQLPLLCELSLSNTRLGDAGLQLLLNLLLSLDKHSPIK